MTTKKVDELTIEELNEQVALCQGWYLFEGLLWKNGKHFVCGVNNYDPCRNTQQAFEIIEREKINMVYFRSQSKKYCHWKSTKNSGNDFLSIGETPLISAMRCFVKSIKGEKVEV